MPASRIYSWTGTFDALEPEDRTVAARLVAAGGAIDATAEDIAVRLGNARLVALLRNQGTDRVIAVGSLKNPIPGYRAGRFELAGVPILGFEAAPELGYVAVAEDMRRKGHSERIVGLILDAVAEPAYATTDDDYMKRTLVKAGFAAVGGEWPGGRGMLSLWTYAPAASLPETRPRTSPD